MDYAEFRQQIERLLRQKAEMVVFRYGVWCMERLRFLARNEVFDGMSSDDETLFIEIMNELSDASGRGAVISPERSAEMLRIVEGLSPRGEVEQMELEAASAEFRGLIWSLLTFLGTHDRELVLDVADSTFNYLDFQSGRVAGSMPDEVSLSEMELHVRVLRDESLGPSSSPES